MRRGEWQVAALTIVLAVGACAGVDPEPPSSPAADPLTPFAFVRDDLGLFPPGQRSEAERRLQEIAARTGVYGVVITTTHLSDPPAVYSQIVDEVAAIHGGVALVGLCTPEACDLGKPAAHAEELAAAIDRAGPSLEPPGRSGANPNAQLRRWVDYVTAVADAHGDRDD